MNWKRMLAYISGSVDQELLLRNEYFVTENRILKNQIKGRLQLTDSERISLAEIGQRLGRKALEEVAQIVRPETILLHSVRRDPPGRRYQSDDIAAAESKSEKILLPRCHMSFLTIRDEAFGHSTRIRAEGWKSNIPNTVNTPDIVLVGGS